jgi:6-pyruvoyltetrahydropterin/6-carboxytetrahydropterin synthase
MVLDFGFLKEEMLETIDGPCDHGLILALSDIDGLNMFVPHGQDVDSWFHLVTDVVERDGFCSTTDCRLGQKLYIVPFIPTAECLARHWFERLVPAVCKRSDGLAELLSVLVWETPNCRAEFVGGRR